MNYLKIVAPGFVGFTGQIGPFDFKDGISVDPIDRNDADRISASVACIAIDEKGDELESAASPSQRIIDNAATFADVLEPLKTASEEEMAADAREAAIRAKHSKTVIYPRDELVAIAKKGGIKALREVAEVWSVRHRSIPMLIDLIMAAQDEYEARHRQVKVEKTTAQDGQGGRLVGKSSDPMLNITVDQLYSQQRSLISAQALDVSDQEIETELGPEATVEGDLRAESEENVSGDETEEVTPTPDENSRTPDASTSE